MATHLHALKKTEKRKKLAMTDKRLYTILDLSDPALGRFLNPDPEVQLPDNTQSYNRYTYCLNNPLRYADPTGKYAMGNNRFKLAHYQELLQKEHDELNVYWGTTNDALEQDYIKLRLNQLEESIEDINDIINGVESRELNIGIINLAVVKIVRSWFKNIGMAIGRAYTCQTQNIQKVDDISSHKA